MGAPPRLSRAQARGGQPARSSDRRPTIRRRADRGKASSPRPGFRWHSATRATSLQLQRSKLLESHLASAYKRLAGPAAAAPTKSAHTAFQNISQNKQSKRLKQREDDKALGKSRRWMSFAWQLFYPCKPAA